MELVTNVAGQAHVTPIKALSMHQGIFGADEYVLPTGKQFEATLVSNNELKIADGDAMMQGIHCHTKPKLTDSVTIENGTLNEKRIDLITLRREVVPEQNDIGRAEGYWHYIKGVPAEDTPVVPECVKGDIRAGDLINDMPFFEVELDGINVVEVRPVFKVLYNKATIQEMIDQLNKNYILDSGENENGYWRKWSDGTLEMWGSQSISVTIANGNTDPYYSLPKYISLPIESITPVVASMNTATSGSIWSELATDPYTSQISYRLFSGVPYNPVDIVVHWTAKGRWK